MEKFNTPPAKPQWDYEVTYTPPACYEAKWTGAWDDADGKRPTATGRTYREAVHGLLKAAGRPS